MKHSSITISAALALIARHALALNPTHPDDDFFQAYFERLMAANGGIVTEDSADDLIDSIINGNSEDGFGGSFGEDSVIQG